ncbi:MAG: transposase [Isosphaeraceae bacterium]
MTFSCYRRLPLLSRDRTRQWLVEAIDQARHRMGFDLWAYVIMPEHVHILVCPRRPDSEISPILWQIKQPVGRCAIEYLRAHVPEFLPKLSVTRDDGTQVIRFWQTGGGYDRNIVQERTLLRVIDYIHLNPVRRGLVERPEQWAWSSAGWYAGLHPAPLEIDPTIPPEIVR